MPQPVIDHFPIILHLSSFIPNKFPIILNAFSDFLDFLESTIELLIILDTPPSVSISAGFISQLFTVYINFSVD